MQAGKTLSVRKWHAAFTSEGQLDISKTLSRIYGGVSLLSLTENASVCIYPSSLTFL